MGKAFRIGVATSIFVLAGCACAPRDERAASAHPCQPIFDRLAQDPNYLAYPSDIRDEIAGDLCAIALGDA